MRSPAPLQDARFFSHEAMHTTFHLRIRDLEETHARGIARMCFEHVDLLESRLSRYAEGSDVSRINRMAGGETLYLSDECHQCLLLALDASARTGGLFDITLGTRIEHRKTGRPGPPPPLAGKLIIHPDAAAITCEEPGREIDLGGIGKGFALDQLKLLLADWGVGDALLAAGASSLLAIGPQHWPIDLAGDSGCLRVELSNMALSASGTGIQGAHIIHPLDSDEAAAPLPSRRVWVEADTAAQAEIWSTALMLLDPRMIPDFVSGEPGVRSIHVETDGSITRIPLPDGGE